MKKREAQKFLNEAYKEFIKVHFIDEGKEVPVKFSDVWEFYYHNNAQEILDVLQMFKKAAANNEVSMKNIHKKIVKGEENEGN